MESRTSLSSGLDGEVNAMRIIDDDVFLQRVINELSTLSFENDTEMSEHISFIAACRHDRIDAKRKDYGPQKDRKKLRSPYSDLKTLSKYSLNKTVTSLQEEQRRKERIAEYLRQISEGNRRRNTNETVAVQTSEKKPLFSFLPQIIFRKKKPMNDEH
jgi:hypothetical protein